jgi:hypothetical protein
VPYKRTNKNVVRQGPTPVRQRPSQLQRCCQQSVAVSEAGTRQARVDAPSPQTLTLPLKWGSTGHPSAFYHWTAPIPELGPIYCALKQLPHSSRVSKSLATDPAGHSSTCHKANVLLTLPLLLPTQPAP